MYQSVFSELPGFFNLRDQKLLLKQAASILFPTVSWCLCVLRSTAYVFVQLYKLFTLSLRTKVLLSCRLYQLFMKSKKVFLLKRHYLWHKSMKLEELENVNHAIFSLLITLTAAMCKIKEKHQKICYKNQTRLQIYVHLCCSFLWHTDIQVLLWFQSSCHPLCSWRKHGINGYLHTLMTEEKLTVIMLNAWQVCGKPCPKA